MIMMTSKYVSINLSERTSVGVSRFQGTVWYHIKNKKKDKSVSLTREELKILFSKKEKLMRACLKVTRGKRRSREESNGGGDDSDATLCFESDEN